MAKLVFGMMQSLDGYIAGVAGGPQLPAPGDQLSRHFNDHLRAHAGMVYGRRIYEVMRYWDDDQPDWDAVERAFAIAWREKPKWVASRTLKDVGPNATLIRDDASAFRAQTEGRKRRRNRRRRTRTSPPGSLTASRLIDEYRLYFRPVVLGRGKPYFAGPVPALRLVDTEPVGEDAARLTYATERNASPIVEGVDVDAYVRAVRRR
jgi:dihydrofolate reductase